MILSPRPGRVPGLESLGPRGGHQQGGRRAASSPDVLGVAAPLCDIVRGPQNCRVPRTLAR